MNYVYKNAFDMKCLNESINRFEKINDEKLYMIKELSYISKILYNEEKVVTFISGLMNDNNCLIVLTNKRIIFIDSTLIFTIINLQEIDLIKYEIEESSGEIVIKYNSKERHIKNVSKSIVKLFTNLVIESIENCKTNYLKQTIQKDIEINYYSKFGKLVGLKDKGIISEDKFNTVKQKLIHGTI